MRSPWRGRWILALVMAAGALSGCAGARTASVVPLEARSIAVVRCGRSPKIGRMRIEKIDGVEIKNAGCRLEVPVGRRTVEMSFVYGDGVSAWTSDSNCPLRFNAEPGGVYVLNASVEFDQRTWTGWITDLVTGETLDQCKSVAQR